MGEKGAWWYPGTAEIFSVPPIISGAGKATKLKFCTHILSIDLEILQGTHNIGRIARSSLR